MKIKGFPFHSLHVLTFVTDLVIDLEGKYLARLQDLCSQRGTALVKVIQGSFWKTRHQISQTAFFVLM